LRLAITTNSGLPLKVAEFETLPVGLDYAARGETGYNFFSGRGNPTFALTYAQLREASVDLARRFVGAGFAPGSRVAIAAETTPEFLIFFYACQYSSLIPVPLPLSLNVGGHQAYVARLRGLLSAAKPCAAAGSAEIVRFLREAAEGLGISLVDTCESFQALPDTGADIRPFGKDDPC
jgi:fatty-acyl-CoA synthase